MSDGRRLDCSEQIASSSREKFPSAYQRGLAPCVPVLWIRSCPCSCLWEGRTCVMVERCAFGAFIPVRLMPEGWVLRGRDGPLPGWRKPARRAPVYHFGSNWSSIIRIGAKMAVIRRRIARRAVSSHTQRAGRVPYGKSRIRLRLNIHNV